jgi:hypothetical protein
MKSGGGSQVLLFYFWNSFLFHIVSVANPVHQGIANSGDVLFIIINLIKWIKKKKKVQLSHQSWSFSYTR